MQQPTLLANTLQELVHDLEERLVSRPGLAEEILFNRFDSGLKSLDDVSPCLVQGEITVIGGPPGIGKTSLACHFACSASLRRKLSVLYCTLGESRFRVARTVLSAQGHMDHRRFLAGQIDEHGWDRLTIGLGMNHEARFHTLEQRVDVGTLCSQVKELRRCEGGNGPDLLVIDNFELLVSEHAGSDRCCAVSEVMRTLRDLAVELAIPIVTISQLLYASSRILGRSAEHYAGIEAEIIESMAHTVLHLQRVSPAENPSALTGEVALTVTREGETQTLNLVFIEQLKCFRDLP